MKMLLIAFLCCCIQIAGKSQGIGPVLVVENIDSLRATSLTVKDGAVKKVLGYRVPGDGGGGIYIWSDTSTAVDDGGGIININAAPSTGRFIHQVENGILNLRWWGIRAYEYASITSYDISGEFNAAQQFLKRNPAWTSIYIPGDSTGANGTYYCDTTLTIYNSTRIYGDKSTKIRWRNYTTCINIPYKDQRGRAMENYISDLIIFQGNTLDYGDSTAHGISSRSRVMLKNIQVDFACGDAFHLEGCEDTASSLYGSVDFSELNDCFAYQSNNGIFIMGCDANKINVYKFNATAIRRWGIYDNGFLGNMYMSAHFAYCGSGTGSDVVIVYAGKYYAAISEYDFVNKGYRPDLFPQYWEPVSAMGSSALWDSTKKYYSGGPYQLRNDNAKSTMLDPYFEAFQPNARNCYRCISINGTRGALIKGGSDLNGTTDGLGLNTSLEIDGDLRGVHINQPTTGASYPGVSVKSHLSFPTVFHESGTNPYVYERYKNTDNDKGYLFYYGTSFYIQPNDILSLEVTPVTIRLPQAVESFSGTDKVMVINPTTKEVKYTSIITPVAAPVMVYGEEFTGSTSTSLTLAHAGLTGTLRLFKNGIRLAAAEFTYSGGTGVTLTNPRLSPDIIMADYNY